MKTKIIIHEGWKTIAEYDFIFTMSKGDSVEYMDIEYRVGRCFFEIEANTMIIMIVEPL